MNANYVWLPKREEFSAHGGDWSIYLEIIYSIFEADFINSKPVFRGRRLGLKRHPISEGKEATFWHLITEGEIESEREICFPRCERIRWPKPCIESCDDDGVHVWNEQRGRDQRIHIYLEHEAYLIVLADRGGYILPWTAYYVERDHQRKKLLKKAASYKG